MTPFQGVGRCCDECRRVRHHCNLCTPCRQFTLNHGGTRSAGVTRQAPGVAERSDGVSSTRSAATPPPLRTDSSLPCPSIEHLGLCHRLIPGELATRSETCRGSTPLSPRATTRFQYSPRTSARKVSRLVIASSGRDTPEIKLNRRSKASRSSRSSNGGRLERSAIDVVGDVAFLGAQRWRKGDSAA